MSLHQLANHMSAQGRGPDSTLVHMSPREVSGLQSLAMAHGGTLTINPQTGLPEAGFLDSLLPTLIGGAATFFSGGTITPIMAALGVGGLTALTSKDLGKGLMAGLGAYGGSGIVSGLAGFGAADIGEKAISSAAADATAAGFVNGSIGLDPTGMDISGADAYAAAMQKGVRDRMAGASYSDRLAAGASKALSNPGDAFNAIGGGSMFKGAAMIGAPLLSALSSQDQTSVPTPEQIKFDPSYANINIRRDQLPYQPDTGSSGQRGYFGPTYVNRNAAEGGFVSDDGIEHFGAGGRTRRDPIENMPYIRNGQSLTPADLVNIGNRGSKRFTPVKPPKFYYPSEFGKNSLPPGKSNVNPFGYANPASSAQRSNTFVEKPIVQQPIQTPPQEPMQPVLQKPMEPARPPVQVGPTQPMQPTRPVEPNQPPQQPVNETGMVSKQVQPAPQQPIQPITQQPMEPTRTVAQQPMEPPRPQQPMEPTQPTQRRIDETGMVPRQVVENPVIVPRLEGGRDSAAKGGLMALAVGGGIPLDPNYDYSGYGRKKTDVVRPVTRMPDMPKPDFLAADGKTYRYDPIKRSWYVIKDVEAKTNAGVETLMDTGGPGGNDGGQNKAPNTTPDYRTAATIGRTLSNMGLTSLGGYLSQQAQNGLTGQTIEGLSKDPETGLSPGELAGSPQQGSLSTNTSQAQQVASNAGSYADPSAVTNAAAADRQAADRQAASDARENAREGIASLGSGISPSDKSGGTAPTPVSTDPGFADLAAAPAAPAPAPAPAANPYDAFDTASGKAQNAIAAMIADFAPATAASNARADAAAFAAAQQAQEAQAQANREASTSTAPAPAPAPDAGPSSGSESSGGYGEGLGAGYDKANGGMVGRYAQGGLGSLGGYSDGGRLLRGPGDGVSDSIPATVGDRQPARLADGEFVVPARIVSELGNGSTEAGARALYKMMDRIQANRRKTTGKNSVAVNSKSHKYLPA